MVGVFVLSVVIGMRRVLLVCMLRKMETVEVDKGVKVNVVGNTVWSSRGDFYRDDDGVLVVLKEERMQFYINKIALTCSFFRNGHCTNQLISNGHKVNDSRSSQFYCEQCQRRK